MSTTHSEHLRDLLRQYEELRIDENRSVQDQQRRENISQVLCVASGTHDLDSALKIIRRHLDAPARGR